MDLNPLVSDLKADNVCLMQEFPEFKGTIFSLNYFFKGDALSCTAQKRKHSNSTLLMLCVHLKHDVSDDQRS